MATKKLTLSELRSLVRKMVNEGKSDYDVDKYNESFSVITIGGLSGNYPFQFLHVEDLVRNGQLTNFAKTNLTKNDQEVILALALDDDGPFGHDGNELIQFS